MSEAGAFELPESLARVLQGRGIATDEETRAFLSPSLDGLTSPDVFPQMAAAVERLRRAIRDEEPVAIYADRDVDGLTGLAILVRTLRSLGTSVLWGSPCKGRGLERAVLETLVQGKARVILLVDCGTGEMEELEWLAAEGMDVIVADHHRFTHKRPPALAWIHPGVAEGPGSQSPAGCVMAFKLAQALWTSFLGSADRERMDYFLFDHLDLVCLGILADRVPLVGENRTLTWHGLRRLAATRKTGLSALLRFFRLAPRSGPITVHEANWQIIPMLNAGGRLGRPDITADLLITEDSWKARACIDELLKFNTRRRAAQDESLEAFEKAVQEQCSVENDPVLVAIARDLEPSVTGLAAQSFVRKYGRPAFLFVDQGEEAVGSGRGIQGVDLFAWVDKNHHLTVKFGGHQGAVGLTIRMRDYPDVRKMLLEEASQTDKSLVSALPLVEAEVPLAELIDGWWAGLQRLGPFGTGHEIPVFALTGVEAIAPASTRRSSSPTFVLKSGGVEIQTDADGWDVQGPGPWTVIGCPVEPRGAKPARKWVIQSIAAGRKNDGQN